MSGGAIQLIKVSQSTMKKLIIANWKCNPATLKEAQKMFLALRGGLKNNSKAEAVVCPPFVYLAEAAKVFKNQSSVKIGAQNCFWEEKGAFTGEISPKMLKSLGVKYVILGHSERVMIMGETNEMTARKVNAVLKLGLTPIVCIGETAEERKQGKTSIILEKELKESLQGVAKNQMTKIVLAYEPLWAIGTGKACSVDEAVKAANVLRRTRKAPILYGGSVHSQNAAGYIAARLDSARQAGLDGLLIGGASLDPKEFLAIIKQIR